MLTGASLLANHPVVSSGSGRSNSSGSIFDNGNSSSSPIVKSVDPPDHDEIFSLSSNSSSGMACASDREYIEGSLTSRLTDSLSGGAARSSRCIPEWKVPHSEQRMLPFCSIQPHTGQDIISFKMAKGSSLGNVSLHKHVFLVSSYFFSSAVFFDSHCFLFVIKFNDHSENFLVFQSHTNV